MQNIIIVYFKHITHCSNHYRLQTDGYVIIPKPYCSGREGINSRFRRFYLLLFRRFGSICSRYDRSCRRSGCRQSTGRWWSSVSAVTTPFRRVVWDQVWPAESLVHSTEHSCGWLGFHKFLGVFHLKICLAELRCELVRGRTDSWYERFEMIEQELRPAVYEQRQTDIFRENYSIRGHSSVT